MLEILKLNTEIDESKETKIIAISDGVFCGTVGVFYKGRRHSACIVRLFVHPDYRNKGIGRELINECCNIAKTNGCVSIGLCVKKDNIAENFYKKVGFVISYEYDDGDLLMTKNG